jgi:hypothetical protein
MIASKKQRRNAMTEVKTTPEDKTVADLIKEMTVNEPSLSEILEIVRVSQDTREVSRRIDDRTRRVISFKDFRDEINVVRCA